MAYSSIAVANFFIEKAKETAVKDLSPMKLQKLVYFAHAWNLVINGEPLLTERIEAWQFGPVINRLYQETKHFGNSNIDALISDSNYNTKDIPKVNDSNISSLLESIWNTYSKYSANSMVLQLHPIRSRLHPIRSRLSRKIKGIYGRDSKK